jgi:hypothetical protein
MWMLYANSDNEGKQNIAQAMEHRYAEPIVTYEHCDIKWYEGYAFVDAAHEFMREANEMFEAAYRFVRIGEEDNDIEVNEGGEDRSYLYDMVYPVSSININFPPLADTSSASSSTPVTQGE